MRNYGISFNGGFAITANLAPLEAIIASESGVESWEFESPETAYVHLCKKHVEREYWASPGTLPLLPRFEAFEEYPVFHKPGYVSQPVSVRFFAVAHPKAVGIFTRASYVSEFMEEYHGSVLKEWGSANEAQYWLNYQFLRYILPMGAYIGAQAPYYAEIPVDVVLPVEFAEWFRANCSAVPAQLAFPQLPRGGES